MRLEGGSGKIFLCLQPTDMRKSFDSLSALVQVQLQQDPYSGHWFVFRNKAGDRVKVLVWDGTGLALYYKRLESGAFIWPKLTQQGVFHMNLVQLNALLEGMDWRRLMSRETRAPTLVA